jgi:hypothetical protein
VAADVLPYDLGYITKENDMKFSENRKTAIIASSLAVLLSAGAAHSQEKSGAVSNPTTSATQPTTNSAAGQSGNSASSGQSGQGGTASSSAKGGTDSTQKAKDANAQKGTLPPGHPKVEYMVVPIAAPENNAWKKKGCWAKFHDTENFSGDVLTLIGPVDMANMTGPFGINWKGKISSIETGPAARVLVYDNEDFNDLVSTFKPGQRTAQVSKKMGFFDEFSSLKVACDNVSVGKEQAAGQAQKSK